MESQPIIGLNMSVLEQEGADVLRVHLDYPDAVADAGGRPILLPPAEDPAFLREVLPMLDGVLFIGGADYDPGHYGGHRQPPEELVAPRRDRFDLELARRVLEDTDLPVLGICGGCQLLWIACGGGLVQDIRTEWAVPGGGPPLPHTGKDRTGIDPGPYRHDVLLTPNSLAAAGVGNPSGNRVETNSFHHQAADPARPARRLIVSGKSEDGIVEAVEPGPDTDWERSGRFVLGVQWHPERMRDEEPQRRLFEALVAAARIRKARARGGR
ncbi:MAG TPA: gamma-glutamyl-gamma-aminobutyrate hydrolase family protein [Syntrophales bacterium]|nr:gamma-glutamyl-gamma-aminobutyrate hydrolase family protein [Syntrophales bacterium]